MPSLQRAEVSRCMKGTWPCPESELRQFISSLALANVHKNAWAPPRTDSVNGGLGNKYSGWGVPRWRRAGDVGVVHG